MKTMHKIIAAASVLAAVATSVAFVNADSTIFVGSGITNLTSTGTATGSINVSVAAFVQPVLSMTLTGSAIDFGNLTLGAINTATGQTTINVTTNANTYNVQASYTSLLHTDANTTLPFGIDYGSGTTYNSSKDTPSVLTVLSSAAPATSKDATITYRADPATLQKAGSYATTVAYTVTGNF